MRISSLPIKTSRYLGLIAILALAACAYRSPRIEPISARHQALESAYLEPETDLLDRFFSDWEEEVPPLRDEERSSLDETQRAVYEIFEVFYTPDQISRIGDSEVGPDIYSQYPYYVVQNSIDFTVFDRLIWGSEWAYGDEEPKPIQGGEIKDFRPRVKGSDKRSVFLSPAYEQALFAFLGYDLSPVDEGRFMQAPFPKGESKKRADFLGKKVRVLAGHWGGWQIATHPYVNRIELNQDLTEAKVEFSLVYEGGEARLQRTEDGWRMTDSRLTWIQ